MTAVVRGLLSRYADLALAALVVAIVGMMIVPLPQTLGGRCPLELARGDVREAQGGLGHRLASWFGQDPPRPNSSSSPAKKVPRRARRSISGRGAGSAMSMSPFHWGSPTGANRTAWSARPYRRLAGRSGRRALADPWQQRLETIGRRPRAATERRKAGVPVRMRTALQTMLARGEHGLDRRAVLWPGADVHAPECERIGDRSRSGFLARGPLVPVEQDLRGASIAFVRRPVERPRHVPLTQASQRTRKIGLSCASTKLDSAISCAEPPRAPIIRCPSVSPVRRSRNEAR